MIPLRIFVGWDSKEPAAFSVLAHSILSRASAPVAIIPLVQGQLRAAGLYTRERGPTESTEFSLTRFLVPYLSSYEGVSIFMDCDMLCLTDIYGLIGETLSRWAREYVARHDGLHVSDRLPSPSPAIYVCKHDYTPRPGDKFLGQQQTSYPRKNWSSLMVFDNAQCKVLTPQYVNTVTGLELHRFAWLEDGQIGELPLEWNWLVGEYQDNPEAKILHYTRGGPWFEPWLRELRAATGAG